MQHQVLLLLHFLLEQITIEEEALLAESIAEVFDFSARVGSTERLDQQLSVEVRQRVEELERELAAGNFGELRQSDDLQVGQKAERSPSEFE